MPQAKKKLRIVVLGSTNGSNLPAVVKAIKSRKIKGQISLILSNKPGAGIIKKARRLRLPFSVVERKDISRNKFNDLLIKEIKKAKPDLILLIGWMVILNKKFVSLFGKKTMNIHPSLLPAFAGGMDKNVHKTVLDSGVKLTGCTLHFISDVADEGPIIMQKAVDISEKESVDSLKKKVQKAEQEVIIKAVSLYSKGKIKIKGTKVKVV